MVIAFDVYQWVHGGRPVNSNFTELIEYIKRNNIEIEKDKMIITGRVCTDFGLKANDILISEKGHKFTAEKFYCYGQTLDFVGECMMCGILTNTIDDELFDGLKLYLESRTE